MFFKLIFKLAKCLDHEFDVDVFLGQYGFFDSVDVVQSVSAVDGVSVLLAQLGSSLVVAGWCSRFTFKLAVFLFIFIFLAFDVLHRRT